MTLFTVGPVEMYQETLHEAGKQLPYFRTDEFSKMMLELEIQLKDLMGLRNGSIAFLTGSGSMAMEACISCAFRREHRLLIINGGSFGARFVKIANIYHIAYDEVKVPFGHILVEEDLLAYSDRKYDALVVNIHETSCGQLYDMKMLSSFAKKHGMYFIVDAISSFLADPIDMDIDHIDALILSSQKALALSPGISMVAMQKDFYDTMIEPKEDISLYLSIKDHIVNMKRGQTPFTPAVGILIEMHQRVAKIHQDGIASERNKIKENAQYFRKLMEEIHIPIPAYPLSNALTPILVEGKAEALYKYLKDRGFVVTPSGGELKNRLLRVGHIGNVSLKDYDALVACMKEFNV